LLGNRDVDGDQSRVAVRDVGEVSVDLDAGGLLEAIEVGDGRGRKRTEMSMTSKQEREATQAWSPSMARPSMAWRTRARVGSSIGPVRRPRRSPPIAR
jgi:hypothetical protein